MHQILNITNPLKYKNNILNIYNSNEKYKAKTFLNRLPGLRDKTMPVKKSP